MTDRGLSQTAALRRHNASQTCQAPTHATRCELGQLAVRNHPRLPVDAILNQGGHDANEVAAGPASAKRHRHTTMDTTYTLRAADGKEYGPVTLVQVVAWVHEGRVVENSELQRSDMQHWAAARDFEELRSLFGQEAAAPAPGTPDTIAPPPGAQQNAALMAQMKSGASWFYWIAGLSLVNSVSAAMGSDWHFVLGLGITQVFDIIGAQVGGATKVVTLMLNLVAVGALVLFGVLGHKGHLWTFIVGLVLLALDGILLLFLENWISAGFHVFVLYCLFRGMQACRALRA